jgi:hypothetical protein
VKERHTGRGFLLSTSRGGRSGSSGLLLLGNGVDGLEKQRRVDVDARDKGIRKTYSGSTKSLRLTGIDVHGCDVRVL